MLKLKGLVIIKFSNLCNFQLFVSIIEENISHQKLRNCWVAKKLMSHTFSVKFRVFRGQFIRNHSLYWAQIFRDNWNCYALSIFRVFILFRGGSWGRVREVRTPPPSEMTCGFLIQLVSCKQIKIIKIKKHVVYWCWSRARDECNPS